jgi:D-alanyl-lipoteichoic acid acyltransferase DltB (MBOAT superfamily)
MAPVASDAFNAVATHSHISFVPAWVAALAYTVQIYFDFSGYSDMAIGIAKMFGIDLPVNFNSPYKATSIIDFWRRWHITLSRFLRDYLYIPLGGSRRGESRRFLNLFVTMVLGGIWHGAGWTFLLWGVLHGTYLGINHLFVLFRKDRFRVPIILSRVVTMVCVVFAWVPFRASSLSATLAIWRGMLGMNGLAIPNLPGAGWIASRLHLAPQEMLFGRKDLLFLVASLAICFCFPNSQELLSEFHLGLDSPGYRAISSKPSWFTIRMRPRDAIFLGVLFGLGLRAISGYSEFIYFHF